MQRAGGRVDLGLAALTSASSSRVRASAPSLTAFIASASSSSRRTTSARPTRAGLLGEARVAVGRDAQLGRNLAERLDDEQLARVGLEVAHELAEVAPARGAGSRRPRSAARASCAATASSAPNSRSASATPSTASTSSVAISRPL